MKPFKKLTESERKLLLRFPACVALLAANGDNKLDGAEKRSAITFSHIKTYSCDPLLSEFYKEADKVFEKNIQQLDKDLPIERTARAAALTKELSKLETIVLKLGEVHTVVMHRSMKSFKDHVAKAHNSVFADFVIPIPVKGITYQ